MYAVNMGTIDLYKQWCFEDRSKKHTELIITPDYFDSLGINPTIADTALMGNPAPLMNLLMVKATENYEIDTLNNLINCRIHINRTNEGNLRISNF